MQTDDDRAVPAGHNAARLGRVCPRWRSMSTISATPAGQSADPETGDAIRLAGVTTAELKAHPKDIALQA